MIHNQNKTIRSAVVVVLLIIASVAALPIIASAQSTPVQEDEVDIDGSTITINTGGTNSIAVEDLPNDISITDVSNSGVYNENKGSILYSDLGSGLPDRVTFRLDPDDSAYTTGTDSITFAVDGSSVSLDVVSDSRSDNSVNVATEEVSPTGSRVAIETNGAASISITDIEGEVSNIQDGSKTDEGILFSSLGGLPETVTFDLTPPEGAETVSFDVDGEPIELDVITRDFGDDEDGNDTSLSPQRTLSTSTVPPGGSITVTLEATAQADTISFTEQFTPAVAGGTFQSATVEGTEISDPTIGSADANGAVVTLSSVQAGDSVTATYTVSVAEDATLGNTVDISGSVTSGNQQEVSVGTDTVTIAAGSPLDPPVGQYDTDQDGAITITELGGAASDYATGEIGISELGQVAAIYASS